MKSTFPQFRLQTEDDFKEALTNGIVAFDTNAILNLYRYKAETTEKLFSILTKISNRLWLPYNVALEFQRNRLRVIADQNRKFADAVKAIQSGVNHSRQQIDQLNLKHRHAIIDPDDFLKNVQKNAEEFRASIEKLKAEQAQDLVALDSLKEKIETVFSGKIGAAVQSQESLDAIYKHADWRFKHSIPPGYQDLQKGTAFLHNGLLYQEKYGDFLIWHQLLERLKENPGISIVFVTDDLKEDWWLRLDAEGKKTIGPRIELVEDALFTGKAKCFCMYTSEQFLVHASRLFNAGAIDESVSDIRAVATEFERTNETLVLGIRKNVANDVVFDWLSRLYSGVRRAGPSGPDIEFIDNSGGVVGVEILTVNNVNSFAKRFTSTATRMRAMLENGFFDFGEIVLVLSDHVPLEAVLAPATELLKDIVGNSASVLVGKILNSSDSASFSVLRSISLSD